MAGLFVYKYDYQLNQILNLALVPTGYVASACIGTSDNNYMYGTNQYTGLYVADLRPLQGLDPSLYPQTLPIKIVWPFQTIQPLAYSINLSQNEDMLYVGVRSQGILVFNITDKLNPQYFYQIQIISLSYYIAFSSNYQYLYYANANSLYTFQLIEMNLNDQVPNVFNSQQFVQKNDPAFMKPYCSIFDDNFFVGFFNAHEFRISNIQGNPYQLNVASQSYGIWSASLTQYKGSTIFYVPLIGLSKTTVALYVYDYGTLYTATKDITLKSTFSLPSQYVNENMVQLDFNTDQTLGVVTQYSGFCLLKFDGPLNISFLQYYRNQYYQIVGTTKRAVFSKDNKYILICIQNFGLSVIQIQDNYKLVQVNDLQTLGAENMVKSEISTDYCFLFDGSNGFAIVDLTALPQIKFLSRIALTGWTELGSSLFNDNYMFVQQNEKGMISVIDIRDKKNISLFSQYERGADQSQAACVSKNYDFSFVLNNNYVLVMPLKSQIMLQSTAREITIINNTQQFVKAIQKDEILQVGQTIQFYFQILYPKSQKMVIQKINIYQNFQEQTLPTWMIYNQQTQTLTMVLDKTNAGTTSQQINRIILLVYTFCPLSSTSFFYPSGLGTTTSDQSSQIYNYLKTQNIIGVQDQLSPDFNPSLALTINLSFINDQITNNIIQTLVQSVWINQVVLQTQSSLNFDPNLSVISSRSSSLTIQLNTSTGKFVTISYSGATVQYSINQNELDLQGPLQQINTILAQKIIFYTANISDTNQISITINDNLNFPINYKCNAAQCNFIKFKHDSVIDIETSYSIQFIQSTFQVEDVQTITYTFKYKSDGMPNFVDFDPTFWLQAQSDKQLSFYGNTQYAQLGKTYIIQITAFDGYTTVSDQFELKVQGIPFSYIFNILVKIIGPLVAILGLYKYRSLLVNSVIVNYHTFSQENVNFEAKYFKKIPLIGVEWKKCSILIDNLFVIIQREMQQQNNEKQTEKAKINKKTFEIHENLIKNKTTFKSLQQSNKSSYLEKRYLNQEGSINMYQILEDLNKHKETLFKKNKKLLNIQKYFNQYLQPDTLYYESIKSYACLQLLKLDPKSYFAFLFLKQQLMNEGFHTKNDWYLKVVEIDHRYKEELDHSPFSQVQIKQKELQQIISHLYDYEQNSYQINSDFKIIHQGTSINLRLIENCIISQVHGLSFDKLSYFQQYQGESLHLNSQQVSNVQGFKLCEKGILQRVRKICNQEYIPYGVQQNMKFPDWLRLKFKDDYLKLQGTPTSNNEEQILIRIFDLSGYIVKQFIINIQPYNSNTMINIPEEKAVNQNDINQQISASCRLALLQQKLKQQTLPESKIGSLYSSPRLIEPQIQSRLDD
ncbi:hypothetical protein ABPG74_001881 [Tetrahymena malaccensis]